MECVEVIVNKSWETEPFLSAITNTELRPKDLPFPAVINTPQDKTYHSDKPRARIEMSDITVLVYCIEDLMDPRENPSSTEEKFRVLPRHMQESKPNLVISVSTAESTYDIQPQRRSCNGSVYFGGQFYLFDGGLYDPETTSHFQIPDGKTFQENNVDTRIASLIDDDFKDAIRHKLMAPRRSPADELTCSVCLDYVSLGVVNITHYTAYEQADPAAYSAFRSSAYKDLTGATIETTHGIVKLAAGDIPTLFVSPITDRYQSFNSDVTPLQNYTAAFNAGIAVGEFLVRLNNWYREKGEENETPITDGATVAAGSMPPTSGAANGTSDAANGTSDTPNGTSDTPASMPSASNTAEEASSGNKARTANDVKRIVDRVQYSVEHFLSAWVFEPNNEQTWLNVQSGITEFLTKLWRDGVLLGASPKEAFSVLVGLGKSMTQDDVDNDRLVCEIKIAPREPAEFVTVQVAQILSCEQESAD
jgi:hypothetical protein